MATTNTMTITSRRTSRSPRANRSARLEIVGLLLLGVLLIVAACVTPGDDVRASGSKGATVTHRVEAGDTLWSLAASVRTTGQTTEEAVEQIVSLNDLSTANLDAGSSIKLPAAEALQTAQAMR